jgi:hypothetical protein
MGSKAPRADVCSCDAVVVLELALEHIGWWLMTAV